MHSAAPPTLRTPRLTLRPLTFDDCDAIAAGVGNYDVSRWLAVVPYPYSVNDARAFLDRVLQHKNPFWGICDATGLIGIISLDDELAYWLARSAWGKGYGFEAAHTVVSHWFSDARNEELRSGYFDGNDRSGALLRALGFQLVERIERFARSFNQNVVSNQMVLTRQRWEDRQGFTLYTPRLTLRPLQRDDAKGLCSLAVPEVARNMTTIRVGLNVGEALKIIENGRFSGLPGFFLAIEKDGEYIGGLGFGGEPLNVAYMLHPDCWGQGLATEALSAFLPALYDRFPIDRIEADHFEDNPASGVVLRKLGFQQTGRGIGTSKARVEPQPIIKYAVTRETLKVPA